MRDAKEYYKYLMDNNATSYGEVVENSKGQFIKFYECPDQGDEACVIAVCHESKQAGDTDFFDTDDMYKGSDYIPVFIGGEIKCEFELN